MWARFLAVAVCIQCVVIGASTTVNWPAAEAAFKQQHNHWQKVIGDTLPPCGIPTQLKVFLEHWWGRFNEGDFKLVGGHKGGRPRKIPLKVAKDAANIVKQGKPVKVKHGKHDCEKLVYYPTIRDAIDENKELQDILKKYKVTPDQLRAAMHDADPSLVRRRVTFKRVLSVSQKKTRVDTSADLLERLKKDPTLLQRMVFIDETTIVLFG